MRALVSVCVCVISAMAAFQSPLYSYPVQAISMPCSLTSLSQAPSGPLRHINMDVGRQELSDDEGGESMVDNGKLNRGDAVFGNGSFVSPHFIAYVCVCVCVYMCI